MSIGSHGSPASAANIECLQFSLCLPWSQLREAAADTIQQAFLSKRLGADREDYNWQ